jgi:hypothetical protein
MHPEIAKLIHRLKANGFRVNLTTTGRRFLSSEKFIERFALDPPHLLALSADDFDPERLEELFEMPLRGLKAAWKRIDPRHGQEQKFVESIYAARLVQERGIDTELLFNMVLHHGNLRHVRQMMDAIRRYIPAAIVNPYPAQDSFSGGPGDLFSAEDVAEFGGLADFFIQETLSGNPNLAKNIHYWIAMAAVLESCRSDPASASRFIAGHRVWQCYRREPAMGAGMYLQIGKANAAFVQAGFSDGAASGHAGCYWNSQTVTSSHEIRSFREVSRYLLGGMQHLAENASPRCPGCSMPRLWFNMVTTELGLNPGLRKKYFELRKSYVGF